VDQNNTVDRIESLRIGVVDRAIKSSSSIQQACPKAKADDKKAHSASLLQRQRRREVEEELSLGPAREGAVATCDTPLLVGWAGVGCGVPFSWRWFFFFPIDSTICVVAIDTPTPVQPLVARSVVQKGGAPLGHLG
jgi:hypothetical protein